MGWYWRTGSGRLEQRQEDLGEDHQGKAVVGEDVCSYRGVHTEHEGEQGDGQQEGAPGQQLPQGGSFLWGGG